MTRNASKRWVVTLYHDEPEEAAADSKQLRDYFITEATAIAKAITSVSDHWQSAQVNVGWWTPPNRDRPESFDYDYDAGSVLVGPDWVER